MKPANQLSILMISLDAGLLRENAASDVRQRHRAYAQAVKRLDIIVLGGTRGAVSTLADNSQVYATGSGVWSKILMGWRLARQLARQYHYDLIDTQDPHMTGLLGLILKRVLRIPLEVHLHGDFIQNRHWLHESWKNRLFSWMQSLVIPRADMIRVVSDHLVTTVKTMGIPADRIRVINTPVHIEAFLSVQNEPASDPKRIVFVGRLVPAKNLHVMVDVIAALHTVRQDFVVDIVGSGPLEHELKQRVEQLGLGSVILFQGEKTPEQLADFYRRAWVLVLCSTNESFGKVIIEAGVTGVPTVASATSGAQTIIRDGETGIIVPINDVSATVAALEQLLGDEQKRNQLGQHAQTLYSERFDRARTIDAIITTWQQIANTL